MKIILILFGLVVSAQVHFAQAAIENKASTQSDSKKTRAREILKNISIVGFYNLSDKSNVEGSDNNGAFSGEMANTNSYGVGLESLLKTLDNGLIIKGGANYEFGRSFNKFSGRQGNQPFSQTYTNPKPELSSWIMYVNGELTVSDEMALFGGGNFNFPTIKNAPGSYTGKLGWQAGLSYLISDNFFIDGMWRSFNYSGTIDNLTFDNINLAGFIVRGRISFE
jgi:hypothetical protein